jgi:predicted TIM-barrel fold metal-dependent hydrolase
MSTFEIIDADGHVTETWEQIARHLEEPYRRRPLLTPFFPQDGWDRRLIGSRGDWAGDGRSWTEALDAGGMAMAVLYPTLGLFMPFLRDAEWAVVLCRAYNTMLYKEFTSQSPRLRGVALLPLQDPAAAARELERAVGELGFVGGMVSADSYYLLGHARFDPIYATAQRLRVPIAVHAAGTDMGAAGHEPFPKFIQAHTVSHAFAQLRQLTSMMFDAVPVRFPDLAIAYLEAGSGWIPYFLQRMDEEYEKRGAAEAKGLRRSPSETVREHQIYFSCEADEPLLPQALAYVGADRIMYASDFPHWDHSYPKSVKELVDRADVGDADKRQVLGGNARRFYRL